MRKLLFAVFATALLIGAGCKCHEYLVKETYWPGSPGHLVVEFPEGTSVEDSLTTTIDGRLLIVSPLTEQSLDARLQEKDD